VNEPITPRRRPIPRRPADQRPRPLDPLPLPIRPVPLAHPDVGSALRLAVAALLLLGLVVGSLWLADRSITGQRVVAPAHTAMSAAPGQAAIVPVIELAELHVPDLEAPPVEAAVNRPGFGGLGLQPEPVPEIGSESWPVVLEPELKPEPELKLEYVGDAEAETEAEELADEAEAEEPEAEEIILEPLVIVGAAEIETVPAAPPPSRDALRRAATGFDANMRWGNVLTRDNPKEALRHFDKAHEARPQHPEPLDRIASIRLSQGDVDGALTAFRRCLASSPQYGPCAYGLGVALERSGDADAAREMFERYLDRHPDGTLAAKARARLAD
jgi:hypothetical protein